MGVLWAVVDAYGRMIDDMEQEVSAALMVRPAPRARLDLHLHTTQSDGRLAPVSCWNVAAVGYVAITDHDVAPALTPGWHGLSGRRVFLIDAVEISAVYQGRELHLLAYFPGKMPEHFRNFCTVGPENVPIGMTWP